MPATAPCTPLWTTPGASSTVLLAGGTLYSYSGGSIIAIDATGTNGCSGVPKVCQPLWRTSGEPARPWAAIAGGRLFVTTPHGLGVYDAAGVQGCAGTPKQCTPLWLATVSGDVNIGPAVGGGRVFVTARFGGGLGTGGSGALYAFDAEPRAPRCTGTPTTCTPTWSAPLTGDAVISAPAVSGGSVVVGSTCWVWAFDATGTEGCSGTPVVCTPLVTRDLTAGRGNGLAVVVVRDGTVFAASDSITSGDISEPTTVTLTAFRLPPTP